MRAFLLISKTTKRRTSTSTATAIWVRHACIHPLEASGRKRRVAEGLGDATGVGMKL
jgi:hypothetical protein